MDTNGSTVAVSEVELCDVTVRMLLAAMLVNARHVGVNTP
jgi:hypothetical protein